MESYPQTIIFLALHCDTNEQIEVKFQTVRQDSDVSAIDKMEK